MKLYNKIFSTFFVFSLFFCFSMDAGDATSGPGAVPEVLFTCDKYTEEFNRFSKRINPERRAAFDALIRDIEEPEIIQDIRVISPDSIIDYVKAKASVKFQKFEDAYGPVSDLLKDKDGILEVMSGTKISYGRKLPKEPADQDDKYGIFPSNARMGNGKTLEGSFKDLINETLKTEFGMKTLTLFLICHHCLGAPGFEPGSELLIVLGDFASGYPMLRLDLEGSESDEDSICGPLSIDRSGKTLEFRPGMINPFVAFCHELNHATHFMLGMTSKLPIDADTYLRNPFLRELIAGNIEEIKAKIIPEFRKHGLHIYGSCDREAALIIQSMVMNAEEFNNILGLELIGNVLYINELSDIYQYLSTGDFFRFGYIDNSARAVSLYFCDYGDSVCKYLMFDFVTKNVPTERAFKVLLQLHGLDKKEVQKK